MRNKQRLMVVFATLFFLFWSVRASETAQSRHQIAEGERMYKSYCASCHGVDGSGNGPAASALKQQPPDLRRIQAKLGRFPTENIRKRISGEPRLPVHGSKEMPVWGMILRRSDINSLVAYVESIQRPFEPSPAD